MSNAYRKATLNNREFLMKTVKQLCQLSVNKLNIHQI